MIIEKAIVDDIPALCALLAILFEQEFEFKANYETQAKGLLGLSLFSQIKQK